MKKLFLLTLLCAVTASSLIGCGPSAEELAAQAKADSLQMIVENKDSIINATFTDIGEIATTLNEIAKRENLIVENSATGEINKTQKAQIIDNIASINELLEKNRATIDALSATTKQLRDANIEVSGLETLVAQLQEQLASKDAEILSLIEQVEKLNIVAAELQSRVSELEIERGELIDEAVFNDAKANQIYYIVGKQTDLIKAGIIEKKGLFTVKRTIKNTDDLSNFTEGDLRQLSRVAIGAKGVNLVSSHPEGSYQLVEGAKNVVEELVIKDQNAFWRNSKILVISHR